MKLFVLSLLAGLRCHALRMPRQYHLVSAPLPWSEARAYCRERYTDLATVRGVEDTNRLVNAAQDSSGGFTGKAWIGLHDNLTSWRWSSPDGLDRGYRNWDFGEPDNFLGDQMCVKMWSGGVWEDAPCFLKNPFVCYDGTGEATEPPFILVEEELSWTDARLYCRGRYTDLASVRNRRENQEIRLLARNRSVWIGLHRKREWSDRSAATYRNWKRGQPDNVGGKQSCTAVDLGNAGLWTDEGCGRKLALICYGRRKETPDEVLSTTTTATRTKMTSSEIITTLEGDSPKPSPLTPERVVGLRVKIASKKPLSEDDVKDLLIEELHNLLIEMGLPTSIKVGLKRNNEKPSPGDRGMK